MAAPRGQAASTSWSPYCIFFTSVIWWSSGMRKPDIRSWCWKARSMQRKGRSASDTCAPSLLHTIRFCSTFLFPPTWSIHVLLAEEGA